MNKNEQRTQFKALVTESTLKQNQCMFSHFPQTTQRNLNERTQLVKNNLQDKEKVIWFNRIQPHKVCVSQVHNFIQFSFDRSFFYKHTHTWFCRLSHVRPPCFVIYIQRKGWRYVCQQGHESNLKQSRLNTKPRLNEEAGRRRVLGWGWMTAEEDQGRMKSRDIFLHLLLAWLLIVAHSRSPCEPLSPT